MHIFHCLALYRPGQIVAGRDVFINYYPIHWIYADRLGRGELPFWNPFFNLGVPYWADPVNGVLYPLYGILLFFGSHLAAINILTALHYLLAEILFYGFLRSLGVSGLAAVAGAALYMAGGYLAMEVTAHQFLYAHAWLPGLAWGISAYLCGSRRGLWCAAFCTSMFLLAGEPQTFVQAVPVALLAVGIIRRNFMDPVRAGAAIGLIPLMLWAPVAIPMFSFASGSARSVLLGLEDALIWSLPPVRLLDLAIPYLGGECVSNLSCWMKGGAGYSDTFYMGSAVLVLAAAGLFTAGRRRQILWWLALAAAGLLLALGRELPFYAWLYNWLPGWKLFRYPERMLIYPAFAFPVIVALSLDGVQRVPRRLLLLVSAVLLILVLDTGAGTLREYLDTQTREELGFLAPVVIYRACAWASGALAAFMICIAVSRRLAPETFLALLAALLFLDVSLMTRNTFRTFPVENLPKAPPAVLAARSDGSTSGVPPVHLFDPATLELNIPNDWKNLFGPELRSDLMFRNLFTIETLEGGTGALYGLASVTGPSDVSYPWRLFRYNQTLGVEAATRFFGIAYLTGHKDVPAQADWVPVSEPDRYGFRAYRYPGNSAAAVCPAEVRSAGSFEDILGAVRRDPSVVHARALIEGSIPALTGLPPAETCEVESWSPERVTIRVRSEVPRWAVYRRAYAPGWTARVNGKPSVIRSAYGVFPAVETVAGDSLIVLEYEPPFWKTGIAVFLVALAIMAVWGWRCLRGPRKAAGPS